MAFNKCFRITGSTLSVITTLETTAYISDSSASTSLPTVSSIFQKRFTGCLTDKEQARRKLEMVGDRRAAVATWTLPIARVRRTILM